MNFGFYVSGGARRLKKYFQGGVPPMQVNCVVHDGPVDHALEEILAANSIPYFSYDSDMDGEFSDYLCDTLTSSQVDYCFCFGVRFLKEPLLSAYKHKIINFHPSLLPAFTGLNAIDQALDSNAMLLGNTAHFIDEGIDTGPIIMQNIIFRSCYDGYDSCLDLQLTMLDQIVMWLNEDRVEIVGHHVRVADADYSIGDFVPAIELTKCLSN